MAKDHGLENASIAKVAELLGTSNGLVMHYFKTKDELLLGLNEYILEQHLKLFIEGHQGSIRTREDLEELIENLFSRKWNQYFDDGVFYSCYALIYRNKDFNDSFKEYLMNLHKAFKAELGQAVMNGIITNDNIDELTEIIFAFIDGSYYYMGMFEPGDPTHQRQQDLYIRHCLGLFKFTER